MRHPLFRMHEAVLRSAPIQPGDRVLYLGSHSPALSAVMADQLARGGELVGIDFSLSTLQRAERLLEQAESKNMVFFRLERPAIPYPDGYFDLAIAFGSYDRTAMVVPLMGELARVIRPEGKLYWHDVSTGLEGLRERLVHALFLGRTPSRVQAALRQLKGRMGEHFVVEFSRRWTHTWGKQSCLMVGRKPGRP